MSNECHFCGGWNECCFNNEARIDALIRQVFRELDTKTTMDHEAQMAAWEGMRRLREKLISAAPPVGTQE
jgi:hypothetical protein